ncbi:TonB-dependent receptor [bacterium SCSIO 12696]|nr:TonB-dependent receptor [bacterium SCSIO 12696]
MNIHTPVKNHWQRKLLVAAIASATGACALADDGTNASADRDISEEIVVSGQRTTYANNQVTESMKLQQSSLTSINAVIDNLPGVTVNEGDTYGFDDWSTSITVRGFTTNLGEQQVGTTIDGMPNGNSNYGGGSKANRFIDPGNLAGVDVSQGTADIGSRSHEALGGTLNYLTDKPLETSRVRTEVSMGDYDARRLSVRYDTGTFLGDTRAWISASTQEATDWITETAENERDHIAAKVESSFANANLTGYLSYDDIHEDNYQRVYSAAQFAANPETDFLTGEWSGVPFQDQLFRRGWSTLRENLFGYVKVDFELSESLQLDTAVYMHQNTGRGDWVPPYLVDVTTDSAGQSEFLGGTVARGGAAGDRFFFVDNAGNVLTPAADCVPSFTVVNLYGTPNAVAPAAMDPSCFPADANAVQSYRHTHYDKDRTGLSADLTWTTELAGFENEMRAGVWYEDQTRDESRDWHNITGVDAQFDPEPYWIQYDRSYPQETFKWYLQDTITVGAVTGSLGFKQFLVDVEREDRFDPSLNASVNSDSDVLLSGGVVWETGVEGLEVFLGYAENFKALSDLVLERPAADLTNIEPETSETTEIGLRYAGSNYNLSAVYYDNQFENRLIFLDNSANGTTGPNFLIGTNGTYFNAGGIESRGVELALDYQLADGLNLYVAYTYSDASYLGTGDAAVDTLNGVTPGNIVAGIPEDLFVASLDWTGETFYAGISNKFTSDRFVDLNNTWVAESFNVTDLYIGTDLADVSSLFSGVKLNLVVNNLLDEDYLGTVAQQAAWIGAPRTVSLSATMDF